MTQIKRSKYFLLIIGISFLSFSLIYTTTYYFLATKEVLVSHSYKQFLLKHTQGQRLIIDSGSNSFFGINSYLLENEFNILTINLADNAGYPLKNKLLRIEKYSHSGDIILLPLEWQYYTVNHIPDIFSKNLLGSLNYYHTNLLFNDIKQIWNIPFSTFIGDFHHHIKLTKNKSTNLEKYSKQFNNKARGDFIQENFVLEIDEAMKTTSCDTYVLGNMLKNGFVLSTMFTENIKLIKRLQKQGLKIFLTWPVVVGEDCYSQNNRLALKGFISLIKKTLKDNDIVIIGDPYKNRFAQKFMLNSYYHLTSEARHTHTQELIQAIKQSPIYSWFTNNKTPDYSLDI